MRAFDGRLFDGTGEKPDAGEQVVERVPMQRSSSGTVALTKAECLTRDNRDRERRSRYRMLRFLQGNSGAIWYRFERVGVPNGAVFVVFQFPGEVSEIRE